MYLKRLEMYGFKSFHEKTVFEFDRGITAVVGPNGSGKSNIADAVRWALGETSAKSLRGQKMEDVIFVGTESRRGVGFAEVTLVLCNGDKALADFGEEVAVSRRLYRSGESQYLVNGATVRLKDVHGLFMDTGIGREGYSIVGQGRIEDVLSVRSEDRRAIFEEAAGIVKFKSRRDEAVGKLEREKRSFERACDIIDEIESQLEPMREQAERARRYLGLMEQLKAVRVSAYALFLEGHKEQERQAESDIEGLTAQMQNALTEREAQKEQTLALRGELERHNGLIRANDEARAALTAKVQEVDNEIKLADMHVEYIGERKVRILADIDGRHKAAEAFEAERLAELDRLAALTEEIVDKDEEAEGLRRGIEAENAALSGREGDLARFNARHIESLEGVNTVKARIEGLVASYAQLEERKEALSDELEISATEAAARQEALDAAMAKLDEMQAGASALEADIAAFTSNKNELDAERARRAAIHKDKQAELAQKRSKHNVLADLERSREGYQFSVRSILEASAKGKLAGVRGAVGDLISVDAAYETCIEVALGGAITDIVVDDEAAAKGGIDHLKATRGGRATFLPLNAAKPRDLGTMADKLRTERGIHGAAVDFVRVDAEFDVIAHALLGRVIVAEDFDAAVTFSRKHKYSHKVVTLAGEVINPGGAITGGSADKRFGILSRKRELEELKHDLKDGESRLAALRAAVDEAEGKLSGVVTLLERTKVAFHEAQIGLAATSADIAREKDALAAECKRVEDLTRQDGELLGRLTAINMELRDQRELQKDAEASIAGLLDEISQKQEGLARLKISRDALNRRLNALLVELSRLTESASQKNSAAQRAEELAGSARSEALTLENELEALDIEKEDKLSHIEALRDKRLATEDDKGRAESGGLDLTAKKTALERDLSALIEAEQEAYRLESRLTLELERLNLKKEAIAAEATRFHDEMWEEYNITPRQAVEAERLALSPTQLRREESNLKGELREMGGTVNVGAAEEYRLIQERHGFMTKQRDDILEAQERLMEIIDTLNTQMSERFVSQFAHISENFGVVFAEMFGGGKAFLRLTNETDPLTSGIEITARPPGKALQNMNLLSGGERALCAIALLFGILRLKPAPFCLLDEIETALDDANVRRFARYLKTNAHTQFIVITHRKGTMESADAIYGVTMQEAGISKLVGVRFGE